jgi:hypothetical protein
MLFQEGNQVNKKLTTDELKLEAYAQYCAHIAQGMPKKAWCFRHPTLSLTWETMEKYIKNEPAVFDLTHKKLAEADSLKHWFSYLGDSARGKNKDANVASLQIILRNMHAWDRTDKQDDNDVHSAQFNQERLLEQINARQMIVMQPVIQASDTSNHISIQSQS